MTISLNGEKIDAAGARSVQELIEHYRLSPQAILIEHNGLALHRREWPERILKEGDQVEMLRVVAGG